MLTSEGFALHCQRLDLSSQAQAVLASIRSSPPSRRVGGGGKNVHVRYTSRKMGVVIQAKNGRAIGVLHTPDYFVIRSDSTGWEEWKTECAV